MCRQYVVFNVCIQGPTGATFWLVLPLSTDAGPETGGGDAVIEVSGGQLLTARAAGEATAGSDTRLIVPPSTSTKLPGGGLRIKLVVCTRVTLASALALKP
jgi:hypothetical protein